MRKFDSCKNTTNNVAQVREFSASDVAQIRRCGKPLTFELLPLKTFVTCKIIVFGFHHFILVKLANGIPIGKSS
jgi:hypothetical protein